MYDMITAELGVMEQQLEKMKVKKGESKEELLTRREVLQVYFISFSLWTLACCTHLIIKLDTRY